MAERTSRKREIETDPGVEAEAPPRKRKDIHNAPAHKAGSYSGGHVFVIGCDDPNQPLPAHDRKICKQLRKKVLSIKAFVETQTPYTFHAVGGPDDHLPPNAQDISLRNYFDTILPFLPRDALIIIWVIPSTAGGTGKDYTWRFPNAPKKVNTYDLITHIKAKERATLWLIDGYIPTRFPNFWKCKERVMEFIQTGKPYQDSNGTVVQDEGNFTESIINTITKYVKEIESPAKPDQRWTLLEIMAKNKEITSNPIRSKTSLTKAKSQVSVWRLFIDPAHVYLTKKIEFKYIDIQGPSDGDEVEGEDEGIIENGDSEIDKDDGLFVKAAQEDDGDEGYHE